jgi:hypothetical protein
MRENRFREDDSAGAKKRKPLCAASFIRRAAGILILVAALAGGLRRPAQNQLLSTHRSILPHVTRAHW